MKLNWVLEQVVFHDEHQRLADAVKDSGHKVIWWEDSWLVQDELPIKSGELHLFHGSLGNAAILAENTSWHPGAFCHTDAFKCSSWYPNLNQFLVNSNWILTTVKDLVDTPEKILKPLNIQDTFFVRPNSPLKPFSGRVLSDKKITYSALDHGFYYDDDSLEIIVAPIREIGEEWRFVVVNDEIVAQSAYEPDGRKEVISLISQYVIDFASKVIKQIKAPEIVYVLDVCECDGALKVMELNPFSGADLYGCDRHAIVSSVSEILKF